MLLLPLFCYYGNQHYLRYVKEKTFFYCEFKISKKFSAVLKVVLCLRNTHGEELKLLLTLNPKSHHVVTHLILENLWFDINESVTAGWWNTSLHLSCRIKNLRLRKWRNAREEGDGVFPSILASIHFLHHLSFSRSWGLELIPTYIRGEAESKTRLRCVFQIVWNCPHQMPFTDYKLVCKDQLHDDASFQLLRHNVITYPALAMVWLLGEKKAYSISFWELD